MGPDGTGGVTASQAGRTVRPEAWCQTPGSAAGSNPAPHPPTQSLLLSQEGATAADTWVPLEARWIRGQEGAGVAEDAPGCFLGQAPGSKQRPFKVDREGVASPAS